MNQCPEELKASVITRFVYWHDEVHRQNALRFVTPGQRHCCEDIVILKQHHALHEATKTQYLERWSGPTRN